MVAVQNLLCYRSTWPIAALTLRQLHPSHDPDRPGMQARTRARLVRLGALSGACEFARISHKCRKTHGFGVIKDEYFS